MSENKDENKDEAKGNSGVGITDDQLPEDLVPSEDNPLAEGLPVGETVGDLLNEGKRPDNADDTDDTDDARDKQSDA
jgi:hypothetical protein